MMMNPNIVNLVGLPCYLVQVWELGLYFGESQNLFHIITFLLLEMQKQERELKTPYVSPFFIGAYILGGFMHLSLLHLLILNLEKMHQEQLVPLFILY